MLKKIGVLIFGVFLLSGCGIEDSFKDDAETTNLTGIIHEQDNDDNRSGTHVIVLGSDEELSLRSLAFNLFTSEYEGNKVQVMGIMNEEEDVFEVTGISVIEVLGASNDEEEGIESITYSDTDLGFKMMHFTDWKVQESSDGSLVFESPNLSFLTITQEPFYYSPTVNENGESDTALEAYSSEVLGDIDGVLSKKVGPGQLDALYVDSSDGSASYFLYRNGLIYEIELLPGPSVATLDSESKLFSEMIASFRFVGFTVGDGQDFGDEDSPSGVGEVLPPEDSPSKTPTELPSLDFDLTYFESLPYEFSAPRPSNWYYAGSSSTASDVSYHYGLSDEEIGDDGGNEIIGLDVFTGTIPSGTVIVLNDKDITVVESGSSYSSYVTVGGHSYRVVGPSEYKDLVLNVVANIEPINFEE